MPCTRVSSAKALARLSRSASSTAKVPTSDAQLAHYLATLDRQLLFAAGDDASRLLLRAAARRSSTMRCASARAFITDLGGLGTGLGQLMPCTAQAVRAASC